MFRLRSKSLYVWVGIGILFLGIVLSVVAVRPLRQGLIIVALKAKGSLPGITWMDLYRMARPGNPHFNLSGLATFTNTPTPYGTIINDYTSATDILDGHKIFQIHCAVCHGSDGSGGHGGPSLQGRQMVNGSSDWALFRTITYGIRGTAMPPHNLPWVEKWQLVAYVKSLMLSGTSAKKSVLSPGLHIAEPVTYASILAADQNQNEWLTYSGAYDSQRFSPIGQITSANVGGLRLLWMRQYHIWQLLEMTPLVIDGYMFVTVPPDRVQALDAKTGKLIWSYSWKLPRDLQTCCYVGSRGLAVLGDTLYLATMDAHLVALDIGTGHVRWAVEIADYRKGYTITGAPLALKNMVVTGVAGGEFGAPGFVEARNAATGKEIWRFNTVRRPGKTGASTWEGSSWKRGGSPTWMTGSFDPQTNLLYWATGNPSPLFNGSGRKGADLYSDSVLALDADHGTLRWYFQFTPHDVWDWDATEIMVLFDKDIAGKEHRYLAEANRNGFYYLLNRVTGRFILARPFAKQTWAKKIDGNGRPAVIPAARPTRRGTVVYPNGGATNWMSPTYSPLTGFIYIPAWNKPGTFYLRHHGFNRGEPTLDGFFRPFTGVQPQGTVVALNALTGQREWEFRNPASIVGGLLSTSGGIVFGSQQGRFFALDAKTGRELWSIRTGKAIPAAPITFLYDGKQMVTIAAGHDLLTFAL